MASIASKVTASAESVAGIVFFVKSLVQQYALTHKAVAVLSHFYHGLVPAAKAVPTKRARPT